MTEDRIILPCLDEKGINGKRINNYRQWLDRVKQYMKRKNEIDTGPLTKQETMTGIEWISKEEKIHQDFLWALRPKAAHQITQSEYLTDPDNLRKEKLNKLYKSYYLTKRKKYNSRGDFFWANQTDTETTEGHWEKKPNLKKNAIFQKLPPNYLNQNS